MKIAVLMTVLLASSAAFYADAAKVVTPTGYLHPQRLIAVEGTRRLNLYCVGQGRPTVVFDAGGGSSAAVWRLVQPIIAKTTRACSYDRAGYGFSDPPDGISDAKGAVADLHRLIAAAPIETPIIYVGHSIAGEYGVLYQATYPRSIAAEVLVDPSFADEEFAEAAPLPPQQHKESLETENDAIGLRKCAAMPAPFPKACLHHDSHAGPGDAELTALEQWRVSRRSYILTRASETESVAVTHEQKSLNQRELEAMPTTFADKPLLILTHSKAPPEANFTAPQNAAIQRAWSEGHDRLARLSSRGSNVIVPESGHYIMIDQPQAVIDAVLKAVSQVRGSHG